VESESEIGSSNGKPQVIISCRFKAFAKFYGVTFGKRIRFILVAKSLFKVEILERRKEPRCFLTGRFNIASHGVVDLCDDDVCETLASNVKPQTL